MDGQQGQLEDPLARPVWHALTGRQSGVAQARGGAVRMRPDIGVFAAHDGSQEGWMALASLPCDADGLWCVEREAVAPPPGLTVHRQAACVQMIADHIDLPEPAFAVETLGDDDAQEMLALARLTQPGPFFANTNRLGNFIGVRYQGRLIAMAGERLRPPGFTEVSGVCTHPEHRGHGYAGGLMRIVAARIAARGDRPFLTSYADNDGANALYRRIGFRMHAAVVLTVLVRDAPEVSVIPA